MTTTPGNSEDPTDDPMTRRNLAAFLMGIAAGCGITLAIAGVAGVLG